MTKIIKEWYQELPSPIREKALKYAEERWSLGFERNSLAGAILHWFVWEDTEEWDDYWHKIYKWDYEVKTQEQPNLPDTLEINGILYKRV